jgi:hypothetical protein
MRLVNMHTAPLDNGHSGQRKITDADGQSIMVEATGFPASVEPGSVGDFNEKNPAVAGWIAARLLISEGELVASRASALVDAPSVLAVAMLKSQLADKDVIINDLRARDQARAEEWQRADARFTELAASHESVASLEAQIADLTAQLTARNAEIAALHADLAAATAPAAPSTAPAPATPATAPSTDTEVSSPSGGRATRKG